MRVRKHSYAHRLLVANEDRVIASAPVVSENGMFLGMRGSVKVVAAGDVATNKAVIFAMRGVVVVHNDWAIADFTDDELWDVTVPKDAALSGTAGTQQIDTGGITGAEITTPFAEPGLPNITVLAQDQGIFAQTVLDQSHIMTFADTSDGFKDATPDTYVPNLSLRSDSNHRVKMEGSAPGYAMLGVGNPDMDNTEVTVQAMLTGREFLMLKHLHQLMEDSWKQFAGLDEAGAESPFIDIAALIVEMTEPLVQEETGGAWSAASFNVWSETWIDTEVPYNSVVPRTLTAG